MDCIWCGELVGDEHPFVEDDGEQFHDECFEKYTQAVDKLKYVYRNPDPADEIFIDGGTETRH